MAQKSRKNHAKSNTVTLRNLHTGALVVNILFLASHFLFRPRSLVLYFVLSLAAFFCQFTLERSGRPKYDAATGTLKSAGEDLSAPGLTEYMFDVIWVTWAADVLVILFGNGGWLLWSVVPLFGAWKLYSLFGAARGMTTGLGGAEGAVPAGNRKQRRAAAN